MNQTQRKFLMDKIQKEVKNKIKILKDCKPDAPCIKSYLLLAIMSGNAKIRSSEEIETTLKDRAVNSKEGKDWLMPKQGYFAGSSNGVTFRYEEVFVIPEEYQIKKDNYLKECDKINEEVYQIQVQCDTLMTRIQLASNSVLESMIREIDDMGDIKLMDTKLKLLNK
jgi:hypothetical protein